MAYEDRVGGGFNGFSSVGIVYSVLLVRPWSFYPRGDCCGGFGLVRLCHTLFVFACALGHTTLALFVPLGLRFVCLVAVVCSPAACGSLSRFRWGSLHTVTSLRVGCPLGMHSYHLYSIPRCWWPFVHRVFFGGVHFFLVSGGL